MEKTQARANSLTWSLVITWIIPILFLAVCSRFTQYNGPSVKPAASRPISIAPEKLHQAASKPKLSSAQSSSRPSSRPSSTPSMIASKPTSYQEVVSVIERRRLDWTTEPSRPTFDYYQGGQLVHTRSSSSKSPSNLPNKSPSKRVDRSSQATEKLEASQATTSNVDAGGRPKGMSTDPVRLQHLELIDQLRNEHTSDPSNLYKTLDLADSLRLYDVKYHDGGSLQEEAIKVYDDAIRLAKMKRDDTIERGEDPTRSLSDRNNDINGEVMLDYESRSPDGLLCAIYCGIGKTYFMANMFERAVDSYSACIDIAPLYLDAVSSRGSARIILGEYVGAATDFETVIEADKERRFQDAFTGLARVLQAQESASQHGWEPMIAIVEELIERFESQFDTLQVRNAQVVIANSLNRLYHVLFLYHDVKTLDVPKAWQALTASYDYKAKTLEPWNSDLEKQKIEMTKSIFRSGFWPQGVGSSSKAPIFIIGFVRSGSTLLERVLDAHPEIVGTGENSVFNGRLDEIRNKIVEASMLGDPKLLSNVIEGLAQEVVDEMDERWRMVASADSNNMSSNETQHPSRFVDKMLTNYYNVGFIHMLFPNALILHVAREPMDTLLSAYKHEFPSGPLDYTSFFPSLAEMYGAYRDLIDHWDTELPGRVTHVRYEDMVNDMPTLAKQIIQSTGLDWNEGVLEFHKKKHAVNTLSTTQVRKGIYKNSIQAWRKYEQQLQPLVELVGSRQSFGDLKTTLPDIN